MNSRIKTLLKIWRIHFVVALLVGLVVGTLIGIGEGIWVLQSQGLFGRYNELVAWAIAFDAPAMVGVELGLAVLSAIFFSFMEKVPSIRGLVSLQLGETAYVLVLGWGIWLEGSVNPAVFVGTSLLILLPFAAFALALGQFVLAVAIMLLERAPILQSFRIRYLLALEAIVIAIAIAFGFSR